jgi:hypothetical protein
MMFACAVVQEVGITGRSPFCTTDSATYASRRTPQIRQKGGKARIVDTRMGKDLKSQERRLEC